MTKQELQAKYASMWLCLEDMEDYYDACMRYNVYEEATDEYHSLMCDLAQMISVHAPISAALEFIESGLRNRNWRFMRKLEALF